MGLTQCTELLLLKENLVLCAALVPQSLRCHLDLFLSPLWHSGRAGSVACEGRSRFNTAQAPDRVRLLCGELPGPLDTPRAVSYVYGDGARAAGGELTVVGFLSKPEASFVPQ